MLPTPTLPPYLSLWNSVLLADDFIEQVLLILNRYHYSAPLSLSLSLSLSLPTAIIRATNPHDGQTAAHRAALAGKQENLSLLLHYDPECVLAKDLVGDTPLHLACRVTQKKTYRKIVEMLLVGSHTSYCHVSILHHRDPILFLRTAVICL